MLHRVILSPYTTQQLLSTDTGMGAHRAPKGVGPLKQGAQQDQQPAACKQALVQRAAGEMNRWEDKGRNQSTERSEEGLGRRTPCRFCALSGSSALCPLLLSAATRAEMRQAKPCGAQTALEAL